MSDWQIGDLAVCVDTAPRPPRTKAIGPRLVLGQIYTVEAVFPGSFSGILMLGMRGIPWIDGRAGWDADRFRKVVRDKHESCEPEFVTLLKRAKRPVSA